MTHTGLHVAFDTHMQDETRQTPTGPPALDGTPAHGLKARPTAVTEQASSMPTAFADACTAQHAAAAGSNIMCTCHDACWQSAPSSFSHLITLPTRSPPPVESLHNCHLASWFSIPQVSTMAGSQHEQGHQLASLSSSAAAASAPGRTGFRQRRGSMSAPSEVAGALTVPRHCAVPQWHASNSSPQNLRAGRGRCCSGQAAMEQGGAPLSRLWLQVSSD